MTDQPPTSTERDAVLDRGGRGGTGWGWILAGILIIVIVLLGAWWLWQGGGTPVRELRSASLGMILEQSPELEDTQVVVSGRVERLLTENAMTLGSGLVEGEVLVLMPPGAFAPIGGVGGTAGGPGSGVAGFVEGEFVQITGTLRAFDAAAMSDDFGLVLAPELFDQFEEGPAIITEFFDIAAPARQVQAPVEPEVVEVGAVLADPGSYAGQAVRIEGSLGEVVSERAFTLTAPDSEGALIVVGEDTGRFDEVAAGQRVRVEGTILDFDADALREQVVVPGEGIDFSEFEGKPAVVPTLVEVVEAETTGSPPAGAP